jgi:diguanylate cyclase (GGDEF)-like protein
MGAAGALHHDAAVLSPSWPVPDRSSRPLPSPRVRRRVDAAQRRALRSTVFGSCILIGAFVAFDAVVTLLATGVTGPMTPLEATVVALCVAGAIVVRRGLARPEGVALTQLLLALALALGAVVWEPDGRLLAAAEIAIIIVGSGLFLPWSPRWHAAWLGAALALIAGVLLVPTLAPIDRFPFILSALMASATSLIGQRIWQQRLRRMLAQQFELRWLSRYSQLQEARVSELNRELSRTARIDTLTGVGNRRALDEALSLLLDQGERVRPARFAVLLFDLDHFKSYNDEHGHLAGDEALSRMGAVLRQVTRRPDLAFRYGGEEFLLLLPEVNLPDAVAVAERVRSAVEDAGVFGVPGFTVSGGVALCDPADGRDPAPLLRRADGALYLAKRGGRNRIAADELSAVMQRREIASA